MNSRVGIVAGAVAGILGIAPAALAQMTLQRTPKPIVLADNETWYQAGVPITYAGNIYYPTGPLVHFNANEMVRSGHFQGIPLYTRTTLEPYSLVFVPLRGGLMQPYERRRSGDLADTVGSLSPSFPVVRSAEQSGMDYVPGAGMVQAQAPPSRVGTIPDYDGIDTPGQTSAAASYPTGTTGAPAAGPFATARRAQGVNGVFIEFDDRRYFADGPAVSFNERLFTRVGEYHGFPVFRRSGQDQTLYIPPLAGSFGLLTPYRVR